MAFTFSRARTKILVLILATLAAGCSSPGGRAASADGPRGDPLVLERLQVGSIYGNGSHFSSDGIDFSVEGFGEGLGNTEISSLADPKAGAKERAQAAKTLRISSATLRFRGRRSSGIEFDFVDDGRFIALEIGGVKRSAADFIALDGTVIGTVRIAVKEANTAGVRRGHVRLSGSIDKFAIAGSDLELVDLRLSR